MNRFSRSFPALIWLIAMFGLNACGGINPREQELEATVAALQTQVALPTASIAPAASPKPIIQTVIVRETAPAQEVTPVVQTVVVRETAPPSKTIPVVQTVVARETVIVEMPVTVTVEVKDSSATSTPESAATTPDSRSPASIDRSGPPLLGSGVRIDPIVEGETKSGQGRLVIKAQNGKGEAINGAYFRVYSQKKDLSDQVVIDREITNAYTDSTGTLVFDLDPGNYIVRADFIGYNWGDAREVNGQTYVPVEAGKITHSRCRSAGWWSGSCAPTNRSSPASMCVCIARNRTWPASGCRMAK